MKQRNYGIDLLRIAAMFLIVILHISGQGGVLDAVENDEAKFVVSWFLEIASYCAVNCYALITGFVCFSEEDRPHKFAKYISLWLQVEFYSVLVTLIFKACKPDVISIKQLIKSIVPVSSGQYWYFSAYTGVFFMIPWLNKIVQNLKREKLKTYMICLVGFSCYVTIAGIFGDPFILKQGYSFLWLAVLYVIGAYIKKYELYYEVKKRNTVLVILLLIMITLSWKIGIGKLTLFFLGRKTATNLIVSYLSPTILGIAIAMLCLFANLNIKAFWENLIKFFSSSAFAVYLIHVQPIVYNYVIAKRYMYIADLPVYVIPIAVIMNAFLIFILGICVDKIRILIFKMLKIDKLAENIQMLITRFGNKLISNNQVEQE